METIITILSIALLYTIGTSIHYFKKCKSIKSDVTQIITDLSKHNRKGYYKIGMMQGDIKYKPILYVTEIDRYTNGDSKIQLDRIELCCGDSQLNHQSANNYIINDFESLVPSTKVTWLDSENEIKEIRKEKLQRLKTVKL
jgi:hypothetical protein